MRSGALLMGAPQYWPLTEATVALGHRLGLPVRAGGALTDAHVPDAQAGAESALGLDAALRAGVDSVLHAAGILSSFNSFSLAKFVVDDELLGALRRATGPSWSTTTRLPSTSSRPSVPGHVPGPGRTRDVTPATASRTAHEPRSHQTWRALGGRDLGCQRRAPRRRAARRLHGARRSRRASPDASSRSTAWPDRGLAATTTIGRPADARGRAAATDTSRQRKSFREEDPVTDELVARWLRP